MSDDEERLDALGVKRRAQNLRDDPALAALIVGIVLSSQSEGDTALAEFVAEAAPPSRAWTRDAACRGTDPEIFFLDGRGGSVAAARALCARCPVVESCRAYSVANGEPAGVWGALSVRERQRVRTDLQSYERVCERCGIRFEAAKQGRPHRFCSGSCRTRAWKEQRS